MVFPALIHQATKQKIKNLLIETEDFEKFKQMIIKIIKRYMEVMSDYCFGILPYAYSKEQILLKEYGYNNFQIAIFLDYTQNKEITIF